MSIQETRLKDIADAIREKDGTAGPIPANDFAERILAIPTSGSLPDDVRTITLTADPPEGGTVSGGGVASDGMSITITAAKNGGYYFDGWKENGSFVSKESDYSFQIDADRALVALFAKTRVPSGYTQIEYIESNGTEYIDTEVIPDSGTPCQTKVSADIQFLGELDSVTYYFSSYKPYYNYSTKKTWYSGYYMFRNANGNYANIQTAQSLQDKKINNVSNKRIALLLDGPESVASVNEEQVNLGSSAHVITSMPAICLLCLNNDGTKSKIMPAKLFSCQIEKEGSLVRDFVPCIDPSGSVGLYDLIDEKFFGNAGTGTFTAGPVVEL